MEMRKGPARFERIGPFARLNDFGLPWHLFSVASVSFSLCSL